MQARGQRRSVPDVELPMRKLLFLATVLGLASATFARPIASVRDVRTVYDAGGRGDRYFNASLRRSMRAMGFRFVPSLKGADAILRSSGNGTNQSGFRGQASLRSLNGRKLWSAQVKRAPKSNAMAFASLAAKLRAARS